MLSQQTERPDNPHALLKSQSRPAPEAGWAGHDAPVQASPPPALTAAPDARALLLALRHRWDVALCLGLFVAANLAAAVWVLVPVQYVATASVQVAANRPVLIQQGQPRYDVPTFMKSQAARIKNRDVLTRALADEQARNLTLVRRHPDTESAVLWLDEELQIDYGEGSDSLNVSLTGSDPEELVVLVNAVTKSYLGLVHGKDRNQRCERVARMQGQAKATEEKLAENIAAREALFARQGAADSAAMVRQRQALTQQLQETQKQLDQVRFQLEKAQTRLADQQAPARPLEKSLGIDPAVAAALDADPAVRQNLGLMVGLQELLTRMKAEGHPETESSYRMTSQRYQAVRQEIENRREGLRKELLKRHREKADAEHNALTRKLEREVGPLQTHEKHLLERVQALTRDRDNVALSASRVDQLTAEIQKVEKTRDALQDQLKDFQVEEESRPRVTMRKEASRQPMNSHTRLVLLLLVPLAGLGGVAAAVAWLEFRARRILSADQVVAGLNLRLLGAVPRPPGTRKRRRVLGVDPTDDLGHQGAESIDGIRTLLLRSGGARVVMVTCAVGGEGKTTLASSLAVSLARAGRSTLLVDGDLRRPAAHQLFEQALQPGLGEVLLGEVPVPTAVRPTTTEGNLWLLPAGHWDREAARQLAGERPAAVFQRLRQEFDFIVVDSHPVLSATDSLLVGQHVDTVIVAVMRGVSQAPRVHAACQRLTTVGVKVFGAVVCDVPAEDLGTAWYVTSSRPARGRVPSAPREEGRDER